MKTLKRLAVIFAASVLSVTSLASCSNKVSILKNRETITLSKKENVTKIERQAGLVCWGGSMAYGAYGEGYSIINTVDDHMMTDECYIPAVNMGVPRESIQTIMARAGAVKTVVTKAFTIPEGIEPVEINFATEDKAKIAPLRYGTRWDGGMSNITIGGIEGTLTISEDSAQHEEPKYYFTRKKEGEEVNIKKGEQIISESMTEYNDYIPIICIGDSDDWSSIKELVQAQQAILDVNDAAKEGKYLIVGLFSLPFEEVDDELEEEELIEERLERYKEANDAYDKAMEKQWGDHYLNVREYLCSEEAVEKAKEMGAEFTDADMMSLEYNIVPNALKYDSTNLNKYAYDIIGDIVYEKLVELGYLYH